MGKLRLRETSRLLENAESAQENGRDLLREAQQVHGGVGADAQGPGMSVRDEPPAPHPILLGPWL